MQPQRDNLARGLAAVAIVIGLIVGVMVYRATGTLGVSNFDQIELDGNSALPILDLDQSGTGPLMILRKNGTPFVVVNATGVPIFALAPATMTPTPTSTNTPTRTPTPTNTNTPSPTPTP